MKAIELFCGIGISALGLTEADLVAAYDCDAAFVAAFNGQRILPPVARVSRLSEDSEPPPPCDVLCGGPVCKAFSPGATLFGTSGQSDDRNTFPIFLAAVRHGRPRSFLIENSFGLQRFNGYLEELLTTLVSYGYKVSHGEVDCYDYGVPQHRRRVVILGHRSKTPRLAEPTRRPGDPAVLGDCLGTAPAGDPWPLLLPMSAAALNYYLRDPRHIRKHPPLTADKAASTVVSVYRKGVPYGVVHHEGKYWLCGPRLAARLQGVPDAYDLSLLSKTRALEAIGNGFPPAVAAAMVQKLF